MEAVKGERTVSELVDEYGVYPAMVHPCMKALPDGAADICVRASIMAPAVAEGMVRSLQVFSRVFFQ